MQPCVSICHCNRQALPAKSGTAHRKPPFTWQGSALLQPCRRVSVTLRMQGGDESARAARASFAPRRNGGCYQKFATGVNPWVPRGLTSPPGNPASSRCSVAKADERRGGSAIPLHVSEPPRFALRIIHHTTRIHRFPKIFETHVGCAQGCLRYLFRCVFILRHCHHTHRHALCVHTWPTTHTPPRLVCIHMAARCISQPALLRQNSFDTPACFA